MKGSLPRVLLEKEMTRKEFLQFVGGSLVVLTGLPNFLELLRTAKTAQSTATEGHIGFGVGKFGK